MCEKYGGKAENFAQIRQRLLRHLEATDNVKELSKRFEALNSNCARVDFVLNLLERYEIGIDSTKDAKNDAIAVKLREQGNEMYKIKKVKEAWEFYTKSISHAETNSANLGLAYANRSAVFFEINLHQECLMDINRALENNYPDHLKSKLFVREKNSKNLEVGVFKGFHETIPTITEKNSKIECASSSIEIQENEALGRHVIATRDIQPGEILAVEKPFASLLVNQFYSHCHECIHICYNLIPCKNCTQALYCCESCRDRAFKTYHRYECPILATLRTLEFDKLKLLPLKIAFLIRSDYHKIKNFEKSCQYRSDRYQEIHNLIANTEKRQVSDLFERATAAALIYKLLKNRTDFFADFDYENEFKEVLLLHMQTGPSNFHEITELKKRAKIVFEPEEIASGAFAFLSLLNHSCSPNVTRFCYGDVLVLRAIRSIKKGEQCLDNYGYHHALMGKSERQMHLKAQYYFDCACEACENDWVLYYDLRHVENLEVGEKWALQLIEGDVEAAREILDEALPKLIDLEEFIPCKNFCQVQEIVKQCFAIFGNKRRESVLSC